MDTDPTHPPTPPTPPPQPRHGESSNPAQTDAVYAQPSPSPDFPDKIGPYRVLGKLGSGGMGVVLAAVRDDATVKTRVAIKLIKKGWDTDEIVKRFQVERQVLAALNHPNIARVLDAGAAEDGRSYFVMEYVDGIPIDRYCDFHRLTTQQRVRLFMKVCSAVQYAHSNLVVHRDIKPHNILVTQSGEPKLLDFGIAKLLNPDMQQIAVFTGLDIRLMTPEYASPEQVSGGPISTASDVYSLGVLLYELLTGVRPYSFKTRVEEEIRRVVMEVEPARPSTAVTQEAPALPPLPDSGTRPAPETVGTQPTGTVQSRALARGTAIGSLRRELADDLDDVVLMAMRKAPAQRYASVQQFHDDLARHLSGEPVIARPESPWYRLGKVVKRYRLGVSVAAAFLALASGSAVVMGVLWNRADSARVRAEAAEATARAEASAAKAGKALSDTIAEAVLPEVSRLAGSLPVQQLIGEALRKRADEVRKQFGDTPEVMRDHARSLEALAEVKFNVRGSREAQPEAALALIEEALSVRKALADGPGATREDREELLVGKLYRADILANGLSKSDDALALYAEIVREAEVLPPPEQPEKSPNRVRRLMAIGLLSAGDMLRKKGRLDEAAGMYDRSLTLRQDLASRWPDDRDVQRDLSVGYMRQATTAEARKDYERALTAAGQALVLRENISRRFPEEAQARRDVMTTGEVVTRLQFALKRYDEAARTLAPLIKTAQELADAAPTNTRAAWDLTRIQRLEGQRLRLSGDAGGAVSFLAGAAGPARDAADKRFPNDQPLNFGTAELIEELGDALAAAGKTAEAKTAWEDALARFDKLAKANPSDKVMADRVEGVEGKLGGR